MALEVIEKRPRQFRENDKGEITGMRTFQVLMESARADPNDVGEEKGIPQMWWPWMTEDFTDLRTVVQSREVDQLADNPFVWLVKCNYSNQTLKEAKNVPDPVMRSPEIDWAYEQVRAPMQFDIAGTPILNSAGDTFDPPPEEEEPQILVMTITRNESEFDIDKFRKARNKINRNGWFGFDPATVLLKDWRVAQRTEGGEDYFRNVYTLWIKDESSLEEGAVRGQMWAYKPLDQGYYEVVAGVRRLILDASGRPVQSPALLDGAGRKLAVGATPVFLSFARKYQYDFDELHIPF